MIDENGEHNYNAQYHNRSHAHKLIPIYCQTINE